MSTEKALSGSVKALGALLAIGLVAAAFVLGGQFKNFRQPGTITVKGLAEQNFQSERARWNTAVSVHGASYQEVLDRLNQQRPKLEQFLRSQGFDAAEIQTAAPEISPAFLVEHDAHGNEIRTPNGYDGKQQLTVASSKLDRIQSAHQNILALRAGNDAIDFEAPQYLLGNLETIKHSLIKQATEDARRRANEFASTSGGKVGAMRSASQGSFNIYADSGSSGDDEYGGSYDKTTVGKQVRLVVTIEYDIE